MNGESISFGAPVVGLLLGGVVLVVGLFLGSTVVPVLGTLLAFLSVAGLALAVARAARSEYEPSGSPTGSSRGGDRPRRLGRAKR